MLVGYLQTYALGAKFAEDSDYEIDADQELIALGYMRIGGRYFIAASAYLVFIQFLPVD